MGSLSYLQLQMGARQVQIRLIFVVWLLILRKCNLVRRQGARLEEIFTARNRIQADDCHYFAYFMNPYHVDKGMHAREQARMFAFIKTHRGPGPVSRLQKER